jgi:hypothetical protein
LSPDLIQKTITWCGFAHFGLCLASLFIPKALRWNHHLQVLQPLMKQMFWTYAAYILAINFSFGLISVLASGELLNHSFLASSITLFIGLYWLTRVAIQFFYFDRSAAPKGLIYTLGEIALVTLFIVFTTAYLLAFFFNSLWI